MTHVTLEQAWKNQLPVEKRRWGERANYQIRREHQKNARRKGQAVLDTSDAVAVWTATRESHVYKPDLRCKVPHDAHHTIALITVMRC